MPSALVAFPKNINGRQFRTEKGLTFVVLKGKYFPQASVGKSNNRYLAALKEGLLVSVSFYGNPVPVITVTSGVVRLDSIRVGKDPLAGSLTISRQLGVAETRRPVNLFPS